MPYNTGRQPIIGEFYIQNENQDFWLYEMKDGVAQWVRKGNIRDEGTSGIITVPPVWAMGVDLGVAGLDRWRFVPDEATPVDLNLGFSTDIAALERIRYLAPVNCQLGMTVSVAALQRIKNLTASFALGTVTQAQLQRSIQLQAAFALGTSLATSLDAGVVKNIAAAMTVGFDQATGDPYRARMISVGFGVGFNAAAALSKTEYLVATHSLGVAMAAALSTVKSISADFALGLAQTTAVSGSFGTLYLPTNTSFTGSAAPSAVDTTFTYSATGGASEGHLYDDVLTTPAADPDGVSTAASRPGTAGSPTGDTRAAYDLGSAKIVTGVTVYTAPANGFTNDTVFKIQFSDTGLAGPWTDTGHTITVPAGVSQTASAPVGGSDAHRYWRITYLSGGTSRPSNNAWLGELQFNTGYAPWDVGAAMAVTVNRLRNLEPVTMAEGVSMVATLTRIMSVSAGMALGPSMSVTGLVRSKMLSAAMALGSDQATTVTHAAPGGTVLTPTSVLTTFTYTGQTPAAAEAHLYDGSDTTDSADPAGLQTTTAAAYDLGGVQTVNSIRVVNSPRFTGATPTVPTKSAATPSTSTSTSQVASVTSSSGEYILLFLHRNFDGAGASGTVSSVTDARGNTYTRHFRRQVDGTSHQTLEVWGAFNNGSTGTFNVTATWSGSGTQGTAIAASYPNVNPDQPVRNVSGATVNDSDTVVSPMTCALTVGATQSRWIEFEGSNEDLGSSPSGYTSVTTSSVGTGTARSCLAAYDVSGGTTTGSQTISVAGNNRRAIMAALELQAASVVYKVQYSDTSLTSGWTDTGVFVAMPASLGAVTTAALSGSHRYWRIIYSSGTISQNAWLGELQFKS